MEKISIKKINQKQLYSFDIFDTLIARTTATPSGIFDIMQEKIKNSLEFQSLPTFFKENFSQIRSNVEVFTRKINKNSEITFFEIYEQIEKNYNIPKKIIKSLIDLEIETESKNFVLIEKNFQTLKNLYSKGKKVALISDMYFSKDILRSFLVKFDKIFENIEIFVSNEYKKTKAQGDLYKLVQEKQNTSFSNWKHYGDNQYSDYLQAKKLGIEPEFCPQEKLLPYEEKYLNSYQKENLNLQAIVGISKLTRLVSKDKSDVYNFGCSLTASIFYGYASYVIEQALLSGIKTLYFIARDGYIIKKISDEIIKTKKLNIKTKYIYGSRQAWRIPTKENITNFIDKNFNEYKDRICVDFLAYRFHIEPKNLASFVSKEYLKSNQKEKTIKQ